MAAPQDTPFWASDIIGHDWGRINFRRRRFLFARTSTALSSVHMGVHDAIYDFAEACYEIELASIMVLNMERDQLDWNNGFAVSFEAWQSPEHIAHDLSYGLKGFEAWSIHNGRGNFKESDDMGLNRFFANTASSTDDDRRFAQLFVTFRNNDRDIDKTIGRVKSRLGLLGLHCLPVFHLTNGQVLFIDTDKSGMEISRSCRSELQGLSRWCVCDSQGFSWSSDARNDGVWTWVDLSLVDFSG